jgi:hypothetical protein
MSIPIFYISVYFRVHFHDRVRVHGFLHVRVRVHVTAHFHIHFYVHFHIHVHVHFRVNVTFTSISMSKYRFSPLNLFFQSAGALKFFVMGVSTLRVARRASIYNV